MVLVRSDRRPRRRPGPCGSGWAAAVLLITLAATGCASVTPAASGYQAKDQQQSGTCDGLPAPAPGSLGLLDRSADVVGAVMCASERRYVQGQGIWNFVDLLPLPADRIPDLVSGLTQEDTAGDPNGACTAMSTLVPDFVLTLADGSRIRPGVPGDGCHPKTNSLAAFDVKPPIAPSKSTRTQQVSTELEVTTGCGTGAKSPAIWMGGANSRSSGFPALPKSAAVSICRYHGTGDQQGVLVTAGIDASDAVEPLLSAVAKVSATPPTGCAPTNDPMQSPTVDWLMIQPAPAPPYTGDSQTATPLALVELGVCHRLVSPQHGLAGYSIATAADRLAVLANRPDK